MALRKGRYVSDEQMSRPCRKCGVTERKPCGHCRNCARVYIRGRKSKNPDWHASLKDYNSDSYQKNKAERIAAVKKWQAENPELVRAYKLKKYGITPADYDRMLEAQNGLCAICFTSEPGGKTKQFHVDHCHTTGKVRGLLCGHCNHGLGKFKDDVQILERAIKYLNNSQNVGAFT